MTKLTSLGDAPAKQQDQPLSGAGESFIGKISGPIEKPVRRQKTRRTENAQVKDILRESVERNLVESDNLEYVTESVSLDHILLHTIELHRGVTLRLR